MTELTRILSDIDDGNLTRTDALLPLVYDELRRLAAAKISHEAPGHTLQATALVHEAFMRLLDRSGTTKSGETASPETASLADSPLPGSAATPGDSTKKQGWQSRGHFFAAAAEAMRRILIENARRKKRHKRGGDWQRIQLDTIQIGCPDRDEDLLVLNEALSLLESRDKVKADVVKLRFFAGLTIEETALALNISAPTVKRYWFYSRAWLRREMEKGEPAE